MNKKLILPILLSSLVALPSTAEINFSGFASISAGQTTSSDDTLWGYENTLDFQQGSLFALQASSDLSEGLGVTLQVLANGNNDWEPEFKWAFLSYDVNDQLRILAGRQRAPFYMYSDYLDVSYAYPWITPPRNVYELPFDSFDGIGAIYNTTISNFDATIHGVLGRNNEETRLFGATTRPEVNEFTGLAFTVNNDWLTLRTAYFTADVSIPIGDLTALSNFWQGAAQLVPSQLAPTFIDIADNILIEKDTGNFLELGFQMTFDNVILRGEYTNLEIKDTPIAEADSYFLMAGYQFNEMLVHITYGLDEDEGNDFTEPVPLGLDASIDELKSTTSGLVTSQNTKEDFITLGLRYDFHPSAAFKIEYTSYKNDLYSNRDASLIQTAIVTVF